LIFTSWFDQLVGAIIRRRNSVDLGNLKQFIGKIDVLVAGPPCVDWSTIGQGKHCDGPTMIYLLTFLVILKLLLPRMAIIENVKQFPPDMISQFLPMYAVDTTVLSNFMFGHCVERTRRFISLHLMGVTQLSRPLADLPGVLGRRRSVHHTWRDYSSFTVSSCLKLCSSHAHNAKMLNTANNEC
jgi:site-specific DNA-cytosine methylase